MLLGACQGKSLVLDTCLEEWFRLIFAVVFLHLASQGVSELYKIPRSPDLEALNLEKGRSSRYLFFGTPDVLTFVGK